MQQIASPPYAVIVLAAGSGTRMKSRTPKILHSIGGRSLIQHALSAAQGLNPEHIIAVVRHQRDRVAEHITDYDDAVLIADQDDVPGTGRAVECGLEALRAAAGIPDAGTIVVTYGDVPLLSTELLNDLVTAHESQTNAVTVLTAEFPDPTGYGRILRDGEEVTGIVEQRDASAEQLVIAEGNSGIYAFNAGVLASALTQITTDTAQGEKYLTDVLGVARKAGYQVRAVTTTDYLQVEGVNNRLQLQQLGAELNRRILHAAMLNGTTVVDPASTWVEVDVELEQDTTLLPGTIVQGKSVIRRDAVVGPDTTLIDVTVDEGATVTRSQATGSYFGPGSSVGPFAYVRPGTELGPQSKIGAFYETKNVTIGTGTKLSHLGYAGDATIGDHTNIGCGNITANYDGERKHRTVIGSGVRSSSNTVFVAPVTIGDGAYTGAGAVVRKDVPSGSLALSVAPQRNIEGWVERNRGGSGTTDTPAS